MKKLNRRGFTLIELLAVIVIMGILMLVAIPAFQKYINNAKRDTFQSTVKTYVNTVRTAYAAGKISCGAGNSCFVSFKDLRKEGFIDDDNTNIDGKVTISIANDGTPSFSAESTDNKNKLYVNGSGSVSNTSTSSNYATSGTAQFQ